MARSIRCPHCNAPLNLPEQALGRRVKCPKCDERFLANIDGGSSPLTDSVIAPAKPQPNADSTLILTKNSSSLDLPTMPTAAGDLRETFDLPMMTEAATGSAKGGSSIGEARQTGDATALFDDKPAKPRPKRGAEARASARRCTACGGYVPQGMSICQTCGLDLDTGVRINFDEDLTPASPVRQQGIPLPILLVGGTCLTLSVVLCLASIGFWLQNAEGAQYFIPVAGFGIFASIQFLRIKNARLLLIALALGALINMAGFVAMPIYLANSETQVEARTEINEDDAESADLVIRPIEERLDLDKIKTGFVILAVYAGLSIYIISPSIQRYFRR